MSVKQLWINLPVKDVKKARQFYVDLGFTLNEKHGNTDDSACLLIGEHKIVLMLFAEHQFEKFTQTSISDARKGSQVLFSIDAESAEELDTFVEKVKKAGGEIYGQPGWNQGWMYGCGFSDLDGHRWNMLFMDMEKLKSHQKS